jgi:magnesium chelatase subunit H
MVGYLSFLKIGPKLLKFLPGNKARDLRNWLQIYGAPLPLYALASAPSKSCMAAQGRVMFPPSWLVTLASAYWNEGGMDNVVTMLLYLVDAYMKPTGIEAAAVQVTPPTGLHSSAAIAHLHGKLQSHSHRWWTMHKPAVDVKQTFVCAVSAGCLHPDHAGFFDSPAQYLQWYRQHGAVQDAAAPTVAVLLYRKHVITQQMYIEQLIRCMEAKGTRPIPIFINGALVLMQTFSVPTSTSEVLLDRQSHSSAVNPHLRLVAGVEAHTIVRDQLTSQDEQAAIKEGRLKRGSLQPDAAPIDAIVSTIGFPLVGGPAGESDWVHCK